MANIPAIVALVIGTSVGLYTAGLIPWTSGYGNTYIGFPALQAWITGAAVYLVAVALVAKSSRVRHWLGYSALADAPTPDLVGEGVS